MSNSTRQWSEMSGSTCIYFIRLGFDVARRCSVLFDIGLVMLVISCESELSSQKSVNFSCIALILLLVAAVYVPKIEVAPDYQIWWSRVLLIVLAIDEIRASNDWVLLSGGL